MSRGECLFPGGLQPNVLSVCTLQTQAELCGGMQSGTELQGSSSQYFIEIHTDAACNLHLTDSLVSSLCANHSSDCDRSAKQ